MQLSIAQMAAYYLGCEDSASDYASSEDSMGDSYSPAENYSFSECSSPISSSMTYTQQQQQMAQIQRNEELMRILSPIRRCQERIQKNQTRKNAENARRKFSLTNGIRPQKKQNKTKKSKTKKENISAQRWQTEIAAKLTSRDNTTPDVIYLDTWSRDRKASESWTPDDQFQRKITEMKRVMEECIQTFRRVVADVGPGSCVRRSLLVTESRLKVDGREYDLHQNVRIVAFGKAAVEMVTATEELLGSHVRDGISSVPVGSRIPQTTKTRFFEGAEGNLPDENALKTTNMILEFLDADFPEKAETIVLFLVSGGGSALLPAPVSGVSLETKRKVIQLLASNGADITELNTVRIALSAVKGGKLGKHAEPAQAISLIISDIIGGKMKKVASGPTISQRTERLIAANILKTRNLWEEVDPSIRDALGKSPDSEEVQNSVQNVLIGDNRALLSGLCDRLRLDHNLPGVVLSAELCGDSSDVGERFASVLHLWGIGETPKEIPFEITEKPILNADSPFVWIFGGETTVKFPNNISVQNPKGGRNQEMVLSVLRTLQRLSSNSRYQRSFAFASLASDGEDGPTDAAGAFIYSDDVGKFDSKEVEIFLENKNSYRFWSEFANGKNLVKTGKTGNNLMDVQILLFLNE